MFIGNSWITKGFFRIWMYPTFHEYSMDRFISFHNKSPWYQQFSLLKCVDTILSLSKMSKPWYVVALLANRRLGVGVGLCQWLHQHLQTIQSYGFHSALGNPGKLDTSRSTSGAFFHGGHHFSCFAWLNHGKAMGFHGLWMGDKVGIWLGII